MFRTLMKSKLHRGTITAANLHYVGSITIDADLMDAADLLPNEKVQVVDIDNGARLETYVIPGERGSGDLCLNGAAARLVQPGDKIIVISLRRVHRRRGARAPRRPCWCSTRATAPSWSRPSRRTRPWRTWSPGDDARRGHARLIALALEEDLAAVTRRPRRRSRSTSCTRAASSRAGRCRRRPGRGRGCRRRSRRRADVRRAVARRRPRSSRARCSPTVRGPARSILAAERTALNLLTHLCGVATATARATSPRSPARSASSATRARPCPGMRALQKAAVAAGGGDEPPVQPVRRAAGQGQPRRGGGRRRRRDAPGARRAPTVCPCRSRWTASRSSTRRWPPAPQRAAGQLRPRRTCARRCSAAATTVEVFVEASGNVTLTTVARRSPRPGSTRWRSGR